MTVCNGCGRCCDPVAIPNGQDEVRMMSPAERAAWGLTPEDVRWILEDLTPIRRREGLHETRDFLTNGQTAGLDPDGQPAIIFTQFYRCRHYDEREGCTNYEGRPPTCAGYPWYRGTVDPQMSLPPECAFRADQGRAVSLPAPRTR